MNWDFFILFPKFQNVSDHIRIMYVLKDSCSLDVHREVDTPSGGPPRRPQNTKHWKEEKIGMSITMSVY